MKRIVSLFMALVLALGLAACGSQSTAETEAKVLPPLQVGYGRVDISPEAGTPLGGYSNSSNRLCETVSEDLYATCIALTDETENTVLVYHLDLGGVKEKVFTPIREQIAEATGVPFEQVLLSATHTHSSPDVENLLSRSYTQKLDDWLLEAAQAALADRKAATIQVAEAYPQDLNWIRYYNFSDGTWGSGTLPAGAKRVSHWRTDPDNQLQMIRFVREDAKDVFLANWQGHPHREGGEDKLNASSDIVGAMRRELEARDEDALFAYFSGASGNINNHSYIDGVTTTENYEDHGKALVRYMVNAEFTPAEIAPIELIYRIEPLTSSKDSKKQIDFPVCVFSIGQIAFAFAPYEMFDTSGMEIKENSGFKTTFIATYSNAHLGYLPTEDVFEAYTSYEARITKVQKGSAEHMVEVYLEMFSQLGK